MNDADLPHAFVRTPSATDTMGGIVTASSRCGLCGEKADAKLHGGSARPFEPFRNGHYGE